MAEKFISFDETRRELGCSAEQLRQLTERKQLVGTLQDGTVRFLQSDVLKLKGRVQREGTSAPASSTSRKPPQDYGFVFLVDEDEEAAIEGNRYDGDLPTTLETPAELASEDVVEPVELSPEQMENLEILSGLDLSAAARMGKEVAERQTEPTDLVVPELEPPEERSSEPASAVEAVPEEPADLGAISVSETVPEAIPTEPADLAAIAIAAGAPAGILDGIPSEPAHIEAIDLGEPRVESVPREPADLSAIEVSETVPDPIPLEPARLEAIELAEAEESAGPMLAELRTPFLKTQGDQTPGMIETSDEIIIEPAAPSGPKLELEAVQPATTQAVEEERGTEPVELPETYEVEEPPAIRPVTEHMELATDEELADTEPPAEVASVLETDEPESSEAVQESGEEALPEGCACEAAPAVEEWLTEPAAKAEPADETSTRPEQVQTEPSEIEASGAPGPGIEKSDVAASVSGADVYDEIVKEIEEEPAEQSAAGTLTGAASSNDSTDKRGPEVDREESPVAEDDVRKDKKKEEDLDDIFEVYDLEEKKEGAAGASAPAVEPPKAEEEVVELKEVDKERLELERSIEEEMADLFGETSTAEKVAPKPGAAGKPADDFDLSIFKEGGTAAEVPALEEVDLTEMAEAPALQESVPGSMDVSGVSRIEALKAPRGPSTAPLTAMILLSFVALAVVGMALMAAVWGVIPFVSK